jgi:hypothetical protein
LRNSGVKDLEQGFEVRTYPNSRFHNVIEHALAGELHDGVPDSIEYWWMLELSFAQVYCHPNISLCITQHRNYESVNYTCIIT